MPPDKSHSLLELTMVVLHTQNQEAQYYATGLKMHQTHYLGRIGED